MSIVASLERFWFDRSMEPGRLAALRIGFFGLFAVDQLHLMSSHAWRFGAGGVNLAHFDWLDRLLPTPHTEVHTAIYLISGFLSLCIAAGIATRVFIPLLTVLYGYAYFSSMADGYQHHYLLFWLLLVSCFVRFDRAPGVLTESPSTERVKSWGLSLLYAQVAIVYLFTAITKVDPLWLNGWALEQQVREPSMRALFTATNEALGLGPLGAYAIVATSVMLWQFLAAASFLTPRLHAIACVTGVLFHVTIEFIGLEIRWFSYYMIAIYYLLLFPDSWYAWVADRLHTVVAPVRESAAALFAPISLAPATARTVSAVTAVGCAALGAMSPLPGRWIVAVALAISVGVAWSLRDSTRGAIARAAVMLAAAATVGMLPSQTGAAYDYYRYQGGDFLRRGNKEAAVPAYYKAIELNPGPNSRHRKLAGVLTDLGRFDEAADVYRRALLTDPDNAELKAKLKTIEAR